MAQKSGIHGTICVDDSNRFKFAKITHDLAPQPVATKVPQQMLSHLVEGSTVYFTSLKSPWSPCRAQITEINQDNTYTVQKGKSINGVKPSKITTGKAHQTYEHPWSNLGSGKIETARQKEDKATYSHT